MTVNDVLLLERAVERFNAELEPLKEFLLAGGSLTACHVANCLPPGREPGGRASTADPGENEVLIPFINRLSNLLFVLSRLLNTSRNTPETMWRGPGQ